MIFRAEVIKLSHYRYEDELIGQENSFFFLIIAKAITFVSMCALSCLNLKINLLVIGSEL